jgi:Electron transfer DM13
MNKKAIIILIIITVIVIPVGIYIASPLFINTTVNEPLPTSALTDLQKFQEFMSMNNEQERVEKGQQMTTEEKNAILRGAAHTGGNSINESITEDVTVEGSFLIGNFIGVNDGIHNAEGLAKVIVLDEGNRSILRLENFRATNGPDLYVYLSTDKSASDFVSLGRLKGNIGNQNYEIPEGTELSKYDTVLIWCRAFSVLFGSAELKAE